VSVEFSDVSDRENAEGTSASLFYNVAMRGRIAITLKNPKKMKF